MQTDAAILLLLADLRATIAQKDEEIAQLKAAIETAPSSDLPPPPPNA